MAATQLRGANNGTGTSQILPGSLSNADLHSAAAIASSKLATWGADRNAGSFKLTNLATPTTGTDAATKAYVDAAVGGMSDWKQSVRAASTATVTVTYNNTGGTSARGQMTNMPNTLDGVSLAANDRVLLKDQSTGAQNGIWVVSTLGTGANGVWDRATDYDADAKVTAGHIIPVTEGTVNADTAWIMTTNDPIVIGGASGTTLVFAAFAPVITAGAGLTRTGNTIDVVSGNAAIVANANDITLTLGTTSLLEVHATGLRVAAAAAGAGIAGGGGAALSLDLLNEAPSGTKNGSNTAFTISAATMTLGFMLFLNGQLLEPAGADYTLSGTSITMVVAPQSTDVLRAIGFLA